MWAYVVLGFRGVLALGRVMYGVLGWAVWVLFGMWIYLCVSFVN